MRLKMRFLAPCLLLPCLPNAAPAAADDRITSPPADLAAAYVHPQMAAPDQTRAVAVTRDGTVVAYVMRVPVDNGAAEAQMFLPTGTPRNGVEGARIMIVDLRTRATARLCAATGNDWNPSWSPDGRRLAFYSDRDGQARLWLYDRASGTCRRLSDRPVKSLLWPFEEPRWSPDGSRIHFAIWPSEGPGSALRAMARSAPNAAPEAPPGGISVYRHVPIAPAAAPRPAAEDFDARCGRGTYMAASLATIPADGSGEARVIVDAGAQSAPGIASRHYPTPYQRLSASGRWITYFDTFCQRPGATQDTVVRLLAVPAGGGTPILITDGIRAPLGGDEFMLGYRWSPTADELVFARDGELWRVVFGPEGPAAPVRLGAELGPLSAAIHWYNEDGSMVLVGTNPVQTGRGNQVFGRAIDLAMIPVDGSEPIRMPIDRARWSISGVVARDDRALLQPGPTSFRLLGRDLQTGEQTVLTFDWRTRQMQATWKGRGRFHQIVGAANDRLVGLYEDFRSPADLFSYAPDLTGPVRLSDVSPDLRTAASGTAETFETVIPQYDGSLRTVRTAVLLPAGARRGDRLPAVVWFYPGSDLTSDLERFGSPSIGDPAYLLTRRGYAVILTNVAIGPGEQRGHVIDEIMDSLMPQVHRAADLGYVDINRLAIRGQSFGGFATAAIIARTNLFRAAIPSSGVYDLGGGYGELNFIQGVPVDRSDWSENSQPRLGQSVWDDPLRYIQNSPYYLADRIRTPVLILQGTDDFTGARESGRLFAALRRLNRPVELALYHGGGHFPAAWQPTQAIDQMARTIEFLQRHVGPGWTADQRRRQSE